LKKIIEKNIIDIISGLSGFQVLEEKTPAKKENNDSNGKKPDNNIQEPKKLSRKETMTKSDAKININTKIGIKANESEIEKIKKGINN
jgi:hypothetical protein